MQPQNTILIFSGCISLSFSRSVFQVAESFWKAWSVSTNSHGSSPSPFKLTAKSTSLVVLVNPVIHVEPFVGYNSVCPSRWNGRHGVDDETSLFLTYSILIFGKTLRGKILPEPRGICACVLYEKDNRVQTSGCIMSQVIGGYFPAKRVRNRFVQFVHILEENPRGTILRETWVWR